jgi:hypothetical protein
MDASAKSDLSFRFPVNPAREKRCHLLQVIDFIEKLGGGEEGVPPS